MRLFLALLACAGLLACAEAACKFSLASATVTCMGSLDEQLPMGSGRNVSWVKAMPLLRDASAVVAFRLSKIDFTSQDATRLLEAVAALGGNKSVEVSMTDCTMLDTEVDADLAAQLPGSTRYNVTMKNCTLSGNAARLSWLFAAQDAFELLLTLDGTEVLSNEIALATAGVIGGAASLAINLQSSTVVENAIALVGLVAVGGPSSSTINIADTNVTANQLGLLLAMPLGGPATNATNITTSPVADNQIEGVVYAGSDRSVIKIAIDALIDSGFNTSEAELAASLVALQTEVCRLLAGSRSKYASAVGVPVSLLVGLEPLTQQVQEAMCDFDSFKPGYVLTDDFVDANVSAILGPAMQALGASPELEAVLSGLLGGGAKPKSQARWEADKEEVQWQNLVGAFLAAGGAGDQSAAIADAVASALNGTLPVMELLPLLGAAAEQLDLEASLVG